MENPVTHFPDHQRDGFLRLLQQGRLNRQCAFRRKAGQQRDTRRRPADSLFQAPDWWMHPSPPFFHRRTAPHRAVLSPPGQSRNHHSGRLLHFIRPCPVFCPVRDGLLFFPDGFHSPATTSSFTLGFSSSYSASRASNSARRSDSASDISQAGQHAAPDFSVLPVV